MSVYPPSLCPRFDACSVNNCPLDPRYPDIPGHRADKERVCPMEKPVRVRIAAQFPPQLKLSGLTRQEWAGKVAFEQKPLADRIRMVEEGKRRLEALRAKSRKA